MPYIENPKTKGRVYVVKIHKTINKAQLFGDILPGDVFEFNESVWLKIECTPDWNCVNLEIGELGQLARNVPINPIPVNLMYLFKKVNLVVEY